MVVVVYDDCDVMWYDVDVRYVNGRVGIGYGC